MIRQQGTTPETLTETLLKECLAERQPLLCQNAEWVAIKDEAAARAARREHARYSSTEEFFSALDAIPLEGSEE